MRGHGGRSRHLPRNKHLSRVPSSPSASPSLLTRPRQKMDNQTGHQKYQPGLEVVTYGDAPQLSSDINQDKEIVSQTHLYTRPYAPTGSDPPAPTPWWKRRRFIIAVALVVIVALAAALGGRRGREERVRRPGRDEGYVGERRRQGIVGRKWDRDVRGTIVAASTGWIPAGGDGDAQVGRGAGHAPVLPRPRQPSRLGAVRHVAPSGRQGVVLGDGGKLCVVFGAGFADCSDGYCLDEHEGKSCLSDVVMI